MADFSMGYSSVSMIQREADKLREEFTYFQSEWSKLTGNILENWEGAAKMSFAAKVDAMRPTLSVVADMLGSYSVMINQTIQQQQSLEKDIASIFKGF